MNTGFLFIKPAASGKQDIVEVVVDTIEAKGVHIMMGGVTSPDEIRSLNLVDKHYRNISFYALSDVASLKLTPNVAKDFESFAGTSWEASVGANLILNAPNALIQFGINSTELLGEWLDSKTTKLSDGFCVGIMRGKFVINAFYPYQKESYEAPSGKGIRWFVVSWKEAELSWKDMRQNVIGNTNPKKAGVNSIRGLCAARWRDVGLPFEPTPLDNVVHFSGGPIESLAERVLWVKKIPRVMEDVFGLALYTAGVPESTTTRWITSNPIVTLAGRTGPVFELTENCQSSEVIAMALDLSEKVASGGTEGRPIMVLFSGKKGAGKDYIAEQLVDILNKGESHGVATLAHFADPVKKMYCSSTGADYQKLTSKDVDARAYKETHRMALASFWSRNRISVQWIVEQLLSQIVGGVTVLADWRHPSELLEIQRCGMITLTIRIDISNEVRAKRGWVPSERDNHYTEVGLDDHVFDLRFSNDADGTEGIRQFLLSTVVHKIEKLSGQRFGLKAPTAPTPVVASGPASPVSPLTVPEVPTRPTTGPARVLWNFADPKSVWRPSASYQLDRESGGYQYHYATDTEMPNTRDESYFEKGTWWLNNEGEIVLKATNGQIRRIPGFKYDSETFEEKGRIFKKR